jgi:hypothetical protein
MLVLQVLMEERVQKVKRDVQVLKDHEVQKVLEVKMEK